MWSGGELMSQFDLYAGFYDLDYQDFDDDLHMVQQFALRCGSPVLELGCGTGRLLLPLARQGFQVTGVDLSAGMLEVAARKARTEGLADRIVLLQQDMRELALEARFGFAFAAINSFLHMMTVEDQLAALDSVYQHLIPGGLLLVDMFNPDPERLLDARGQVVLEKVMADPDTGQPLLKFQSQVVDLETQIMHTTLMWDRMDAEGVAQRSLFPFSLRYIFPGELGLLFRQSGFVLEALYGSYDLDEFAANSDKMIAVGLPSRVQFGRKCTRAFELSAVASIRSTWSVTHACLTRFSPARAWEP